MTNKPDETEINFKQFSISNTYYTVSFHFLINNMSLISFASRAASCIGVSALLPDLLLHGVSDLFNVLDAFLVRADSSRWLWDLNRGRYPESAVGLWLCIKTGRA